MDVLTYFQCQFPQRLFGLASRCQRWTLTNCLCGNAGMALGGREGGGGGYVISSTYVCIGIGTWCQ